MHRDIQPSLLRVLDKRKAQRLGETTSRSIDVRVIAITNRDLSNQVETGRFLFDLCTQLKVFEIRLPPLRERLGDIPLLVDHFYQEACLQLRRASVGFTPDAMKTLSRYPWPGNVRELRSVIRRVCALAEEGECIQTHHLPSQFFSQDVNAK
jgi:DNA-binding NtrC family response regulator